MNHISAQHPSPALLASLALGQVNDATLRDLEEHVSGCAECAQVLAGAPGDSFTALLQAAQSFSDTAQPTPAALTVTTPLPTAKGDLTAVWGGPEDVGLPSLPPDHPRYRPVRPLGHGGMGTVWLAEHKLMGRNVAVKVIRPEILTRPGAAERFRREVQSAARLHHPNIVTAFDADEAGNTSLLVMEYVEGVNLADEVRNRGPLPVAEACEYIRQAALGLQHAHDRSLVHRDLKPHNLMLTGSLRPTEEERAGAREQTLPSPLVGERLGVRGQIKILDFGLAVLRDAGAEQGGLTGANMVVGTPDYIAPEQAEDSRQADTRSDVYALGCTLYHLLTGTVPFPEESILRKLDAHRRAEPKALRILRPEVPIGLTRVVAKMMAKRPADRYASAAAIAEALEPYARYVPPTRKRRPFLAAALALLCVGLIAAAGVTYYIVTDHGTIEVRTDDENIKVIAERNGKKITLEDLKNRQTWVVNTGEWTVHLDGKPEGLKLELSNNPFTLRRGEKQVVTVKRVPKQEVKQATTSLPPLSKKIGEVRRFEGHPFLQMVKISPDNSLVLTCENAAGEHRADRAVHIWDVQSGKEIGVLKGHTSMIWSLAFSADSRRIITGSTSPDNTFRVWDAQTGKEIRRWSGHIVTYGAALSPDGTRAYTCGHDGTMRITNVETGQEIKRVTGKGVFRGLSLSSDGKLVAAASTQNDPGIYVWDAATGAEVKHLAGHIDGGTGSVQLVNNGKQLISAGYDKTCRLWDVQTGKELRRLPFASGVFSEDGKRFLMWGKDERTHQLLDVATWKAIHTITSPVAVLSGDISIDGRYALIGGVDNVARLWRLPDLAVLAQTDRELIQGTWRPVVAELKGEALPQEILDGLRPTLTFTAEKVMGKPNSVVAKLILEAVAEKTQFPKELAAVVVNGLEGVYHLDPAKSPKQIDITYLGAARKTMLGIYSLEGDTLQLCVSVDPQRVDERPTEFSTKGDGLRGMVTFKRARTPGPAADTVGEVRRFVGHAATVSAAALAPDGKLVLTGAGMRDDERGLDAQLWDAETGKEIRRFKGHTSAISAAAFSPDGKLAVTSSYWPDATVRIWKVATGKELQRMSHRVGMPVGVYCATFSADGKHVFTGSDDKTLRMWSVATGKEVKRFPGHPDVVRCVAVSRDGKYLLSGGTEDKANLRLWDIATGKQIKSFEGHTKQIDSLQFSADDRLIVSGSVDTTLRLWDVKTGKEIRKFVGHTERASAVLTPDGSRVVSASHDRSVRVWDVATGKELHRFEGHTSGAYITAVSADGHHALTGSNDNTARLWRLPDAILTPTTATEAKGVEVRRILAPGASVWSTDLSPDGRYCVAATGAANLHSMKVQLFDLHTGALVRDLSNEQGDYVVRFANQGKWVVDANYSGRVKVVETATGKEIRRFQTDTPLFNALVLSGGKYANILSDRAVQICDLASGQEIRRWPLGKFLWAPTADSKHLLYSADGTLPYRVFNLETGKEERVLTTTLDKKNVYFLPGGRHGVWEGSTLVVFDTGTGKELKRLALARYLKDSVERVLPDDQRFVFVAYKDHSVVQWETATGKELCRFQADGDISRFGLSADGRHAVAGTSAGTLYIWRLPEVALP